MTAGAFGSVTFQAQNYGAKQVDRRVELGQVLHSGDHVDSPNYGSNVAGHVLATDQSHIGKNYIFSQFIN